MTRNIASPILNVSRFVKIRGAAVAQLCHWLITTTGNEVHVPVATNRYGRKLPGRLAGQAFTVEQSVLNANFFSEWSDFPAFAVFFFDEGVGFRAVGGFKVGGVPFDGFAGSKRNVTQQDGF